MSASSRDDTPKRIQLSRKKGYRKPEGVVVVSRPSKWGNPYRWENYRSYVPGGWGEEGYQVSAHDRRRFAVVDFEAALLAPFNDPPPGYPTVEEIRTELASKDLACWCPLDGPCHADVLLKVANGGAA